MIHTSKARQAMIGKSYQSDMNNPDEMKATVRDIRVNGGGHTVAFTYGRDYPLFYVALSSFVKMYPHELKRVKS